MNRQQNFDLSAYWSAFMGNPAPLISGVAAAQVDKINNNPTLTGQQKADKIADLKTLDGASAGKIVATAVSEDIKEKVSGTFDFIGNFFSDFKWIIIIVMVVLILSYLNKK